jgi:hypothetical protein
MMELMTLIPTATSVSAIRILSPDHLPDHTNSGLLTDLHISSHPYSGIRPAHPCGRHAAQTLQVKSTYLPDRIRSFLSSLGIVESPHAVMPIPEYIDAPSFAPLNPADHRDKHKHDIPQEFKGVVRILPIFNAEGEIAMHRGMGMDEAGWKALEGKGGVKAHHNHRHDHGEKGQYRDHRDHHAHSFGGR